MAKLRVYAAFVALWCLFSGKGALAIGFGEPRPLPLAWNASVDSASCREAGRLQAFLESAAKLSDHTVQERMLVSVAYTQGQHLFTALIEVLDVIDHEVVWWVAQREHSLTYRLKQVPWNWFKGGAAEHEIDGYIALLKQQRRVYAVALGELNLALHSMRDACEPSSDKDMMKNLKNLVDKEHALLSPQGSQPLPATADISAVSARVIENMGKSVHYKKMVLQSIKGLNIPGHFHRNAFAYVVGGVSLLALGIYAYRHKDAIVHFQKKMIEQLVQLNNNFKKKFKNLQDAFYSRNKGDDEFERVVKDLHEKNKQDVILFEKKSIDALMVANPGLNEHDARQRFMQARAEHKELAVLDECRKNIDQRTLHNEVDKILSSVEERTKEARLWEITKVKRTSAIIDEAPHIVPPARDWLSQTSDVVMAMIYGEKAPLMRLVEVAGNKVVNLEQQHIRNNALTSALVSLVPELLTASGAMVLGSIGTYFGYRWITSQDQWARNIKNALIRTRTLLDHSSPDALTEAERQGLIIHALHHLQKEARGVPANDKKRFEADLLFLQRSDISDEYKVQRIDSFLGPYKFLKS